MHFLIRAFAEIGLGARVTYSFDPDKALEACKDIHPMGYEAPIGVTFGFPNPKPSIFARLYDWFTSDTALLPLGRICVSVDGAKPRGNLLVALEAVRKAFSMQNGQTTRVMVSETGIHFYAESDLAVRFINAGIAAAAFDEARDGSVKGDWTIDMNAPRHNGMYLASFLYRTQNN
jgi:hypothetical protein